MSDKQVRELTTLEYVILGFLAVKPQSGYAIINRFEAGFYRWSSSAGSIYPVLKRLEKQGLIDSILEAIHETRPRKIYTLLPLGENLLDSWLRQAPTLPDVIENYDIALHKFLIAEYRLTRPEILAWLDGYETVVTGSQQTQRIMQEAGRTENAFSVHEQLFNESIALEMQARLNWIRLARARLSKDTDSGGQE